MSGNDEDEFAALSEEDHRLIHAVYNDAAATDDAAAAAAVQQAIRDGANVNAVCLNWTPLSVACLRGYNQSVGILLAAGADARWRDSEGWSAILELEACNHEHSSTVQLLIDHDKRLLEIVDNDGSTPLFCAIRKQHSDVVRLLLNNGANPHHVDNDGKTALMYACRFDNLEIVRLLIDAGAELETRDKNQQTALHHAAPHWDDDEQLRDGIEIMRELILQHDASIFAVDKDGLTPFDLACKWMDDDDDDDDDGVDRLLEVYANRLTQNPGSIALHDLLQAAEYSFAEDEEFHPLLDPLQVILPLGKLTMGRFRTLLHALGPELIRNRDDTGMLPIHSACQRNAPVQVLALILELDPAALRIADYTGALPIHLLCGTTAATEYVSVRYLVEQGGVGTLAARNRQVALPLHLLCRSTNPPQQAVQYLIQSFPGSVSARNQEGLLPLHVLCESTDPPLRVVQYLIQSFPGSVAVQTNAGQYPFMKAAAVDSSWVSLHALDPDLIRNRDDTGHSLIHFACRTNAPVQVLASILGLDPAALRIADYTGALPINLLCGTTAATEYVSVQYLIQSSPGSVAEQTNSGQYPFMMAIAADSSSASLSVVYELVRANPGLIVPR